jgi:hypothetical protein
MHRVIGLRTITLTPQGFLYAIVHRTGVVGIPLFMGGESTPSRAVVQSAGKGFRLKAQIMKEEFNRAGPVLHLLLRYTQALITQMSQTAVCNRHHSLDQQLCRWLLLSLDRLEGNQNQLNGSRKPLALIPRVGHSIRWFYPSPF